MRAVLRIVCDAARAGSYTQEQVAEVSKLLVSLDGDSSSDDEVEDPALARDVAAFLYHHTLRETQPSLARFVGRRPTHGFRCGRRATLIAACPRLDATLSLRA